MPKALGAGKCDQQAGCAHLQVHGVQFRIGRQIYNTSLRRCNEVVQVTELHSARERHRTRALEKSNIAKRQGDDAVPVRAGTALQYRDCGGSDVDASLQRKPGQCITTSRALL